MEVGYISSERRAQLYLRADVVVMPYDELPAQSGVLQDAYASGRPSIVTDVGALGPSVREDRTGWVVRAGSPEELAQTIRRAAERRQERHERGEKRAPHRNGAHTGDDRFEAARVVWGDSREASELTIRSGEGGRGMSIDGLDQELCADDAIRSPVFWSLAPEVAIRTVQNESSADAGPQWARNLVRALSGRSGPTVRQVGEFCFVSTSPQMARVLNPVISVLAGRSAAGGKGLVVSLPILNLGDLRRAHQRSRLVAKRLDAISQRLGVRLPPSVYDQVLKVAIHFERASKYLGEPGIKSVVVATQHGAVIRAVIAAALASPVAPTVFYLPHAPAANTSWYRDLPAHHALMRGVSELEFYAENGAHRAQLHVVGDPSFVMSDHPLVTDEEAVLLAPSFQGQDGLSELIRFVESGNVGNVELCLHPRAKAQVEGIRLPHGWSVAQCTYTGERLSRGDARLLITNGSGVGLEALMYGVPVIDIQPPGRVSPYCYAESEYVLRVETPGELLEASRRAISGSVTTRSKIQAYGASWIDSWGPEAAQVAAAKLADLAGQSTPDRLALDRWGGGGTSASAGEGRNPG